MLEQMKTELNPFTTRVLLCFMMIFNMERNGKTDSYCLEAGLSGLQLVWSIQRVSCQLQYSSMIKLIFISVQIN